MASIGYSGIEVDEHRIDVFLNNVKLVSKGLGTNKDKIAGILLANREITITIDLMAGKKIAKVLTCDLTEKYIKINAHYKT